MEYKYSPTTNGFYPEIFTHPDDAILCPMERYNATRTPPLGKVRQPAADGLPELTDDPNYHAPELVDFITVKYAEINQWRAEQERENLLFDHAGRSWDGGIASKSRIDETLALTRVMSALPDGFFWTSADDVDIPITLLELESLAEALYAARGLRGFEIHARQRQMKAEVAALTTIEEVQAYSVGWPTEVPA